MTSHPPPTRTLRERPDLDQLRRQAKELLAAFLAGDSKALAEVQTYERRADPANFALHDAQRVLARAYGFESWPKLKAYVDGVTITRMGEAVRAGDLAQVRAMLAARPELADMEMSANNEHRPLHYAVLARSADMVRLLMAHGADARHGIYPRRDATTALTLAIERGYAEIVAIIEDAEQARREEMSCPNSTVTPAQEELHAAIRRGETAQALAILQHDPSLTRACDRDGETPLHVAVARLDEPLIAWLLEHGASVRHRDTRDRTPLDVAVRAGAGLASGEDDRFARVARTLRQRGAEMNAGTAVMVGDAAWLRARHAEGALANPIAQDGGLLTLAAMRDRPEMLELLLDLGFDPNERVRVDDLEEVIVSWGYPLMHCAGTGKQAMAELLLQRGADPNAQVYASGTPVGRAHGQRDWTMVALLERYGGVVYAANAGYHRDTALARRLFDEEANGRLRPGTVSEGETLAQVLLGTGACGGDPEIVRMALERIDWPRDDRRWYGALGEPLCMWNHIPWLAAVANPTLDRRTYAECFRMILARCHANVHGGSGRTILHDVAASYDWLTPDERLAFAIPLLDGGANLRARDELLKSTPLGWACRWGRVELVKLFIARGADVIEADAEPWATPIAWAEKRGHADVHAVLREHLP